jgi:hypothetical protein
MLATVNIKVVLAVLVVLNLIASLNGPGQPNGDLEAPILDGPAAQNAHFNLKPRRNAASVHLLYIVPKDIQIEAFYCEMTA